MRNLWAILYFILMASGLPAQSPTWSSIRVPDRTEFEQLETDSLGFLWGLSKDGLFKYDGYDIAEQLIPDTNQIAFSSLDRDKDSNFLVGCQNGEVLYYSPYNNLQERPPISFLDGPITFIDCPDPDNNCLLISYGNQVLWRYNSIDTLLSTSNILISNEVYAGISEDNIVYLATDQGLQIIEIQDKELNSRIVDKRDGLADIILTNIQKNGHQIWMTDFDRSISKLDLLNGQVDLLHFDSPSKINDLLFLQNGSVVVSRDDGAYFIENDKLIKKYPLINSARVLGAKEDEESNIWLSVPNQGLVKGLLLIQKLDLSLTQVQALEYIHGNFWIGNIDGLFVYDKAGLQQKLLSNNITTIALHNDLVWIGTYSNGLFVFDRNTFKQVGHLNQWEGHPNQSVLNILPKENNVFISSLTGVISFQYQSNNSAKVSLSEPESFNDILGPGYIYQIIQADGKTYFATDRQGIKIIQDEKLISFNQFEDGSDIGSVYSMAIDTSDNLWFASTKEGIGYIKNGIAHKGPKNKNPDDPYTALANIPNGNILLIRMGSIDVLNPTLNHIMSYDNEIGLSKEPPFLNTFSPDANNLWLAHSNNIFLYQTPQQLKLFPEIQIGNILVNLTDANGRHVFDQDENNIQFQFTASWLTNPQKLSYQYQLMGIDEEWRNTLDRTISYPKLNPGAYTFKVRASENAQFSDQSEQEFSFKINTFFYNKLWFWILSTAVAMIALYQYAASRKRRQLQQSEMDRKHVESQLLNLKNQLNPHFLFNSFNTLVGLIEEDTDRSIIFTEKLTDFYRLVLEHGKNQLVPFDEEVKLIKLYVDVLNERFQDAIDIKLPSIQIQSLIPPLTLQLLVENAIKHNEIRPNKNLSIDINQSATHIHVKNKKYPKPFPEPASGSGLENIEKRYLLLNGSAINILDGEQVFEVRLPIIPITANTYGDSAA